MKLNGNKHIRRKCWWNENIMRIRQRVDQKKFLSIKHLPHMIRIRLSKTMDLMLLSPTSNVRKNDASMQKNRFRTSGMPLKLTTVMWTSHKSDIFGGPTQVISPFSLLWWFFQKFWLSCFCKKSTKFFSASMKFLIKFKKPSQLVPSSKTLKQLLWVQKTYWKLTLTMVLTEVTFHHSAELIYDMPIAHPLPYP